MAYYLTLSFEMKYKNKYLEPYIFVDPCDEKITPCSGHGECTLDPADTDDGRKCICTEGYRGDNCETGKIYELFLE